MAWQDAWDLSGLTVTQQGIIGEALNKTDFDFTRIKPGLKADVGKDKVPVEVVDLSRYATQGVRSAEEHDHDDHPHDGANGHIHIKDSKGNVVAHGILYRKRVLGLAWYSGKVSVDSSLERDPRMMQEVFLAEGAHMIDFFGMHPEQREGIFAAYQKANPTNIEPDDGWFEERGDENYWDWIGEAFMIGFIKSFAPSVGVTLDNFTYKTTPGVVSEIRRLLWRTSSEGGVFATATGSTYHDSHQGIKRAREFASALAARNAGLVACRVCKPSG